MIQINLVPDIKAEFLKAEKTKTMVITISVIVAVGLLILTAAMFSFANFNQSKHIDNLQKDIDSVVNELVADKEATVAVTVNNQLKTLPELHQQRPAMHRLPDYLSKVVPSSVQLSTITVSIENMSIKIEGTAKGNSNVESAKNANIFIDTLRNAQYKTIIEGEESVLQKAFIDLAVESIGTSADDEILTSFTVSFSYAEELFNNTIEVELSVPKTSSDQTTFERSDNLFNKAEEGEE